MTKQELADYFGISISTINTNFPLFCKNQLKRGFLITKKGYGNNADYTVERTEKQDVDKSVFSIRGSNTQTLEGEIWKTTYCASNYEVSNFGRVRNKQTKVILKGSITDQGYKRVSLNNVNYNVHRLVLQTWEPHDDFETQVVDHINGIRSDNRLENLRWASSEQNTLYMLKNYELITRETTRLIKLYGYDKTLELLRAIGPTDTTAP